jgi:hypothetical protein
VPGIGIQRALLRVREGMAAPLPPAIIQSFGVDIPLCNLQKMVQDKRRFPTLRDFLRRVGSRFRTKRQKQRGEDDLVATFWADDRGIYRCPCH